VVFVKRRDVVLRDWLARFVGRGKEDRPPWLLSLTLLSMLVAAATAVVVALQTSGDLFCTVTRRLGGASIPLAAYLVVAVCSFGFVVSIVVRNRPRLLSMTLLLAGCALLLGIVLVARDSAVTKGTESCTLFETTTQTFSKHVWYAYVFWGLALSVLVLQLRRAIRIPVRPAPHPQ
jgi:hypothetical protein